MTHIVNLNKELGSLAGRTEQIEKRMEGLERRIDIRLKEQGDELKSQSEKLDSIIQVLDQGKGGWKVITAIGAVVAALGGAVAWLIEVISTIPKA